MSHLDANPSSMTLPLNESSNSVVFVTAGNCIICLFISLTIFGDIAVYAAFYLNRSLKTRTNALFLSLATADILLASFVMPLEVVRLTYYPHWPLGATACRVWNSAFVALGSASVCNLCAIGFDRFLAISRPLRYYSDISSAVVSSIVFLWLFAFFSGLASYFIWTQPNPLACAVLSAPIRSSVLLLVFDLLVPFVICLLTYAKIFQISRRQARQIALTHRWVVGENNYLSRQRKSAKTLGILVGVFAISYLPFLVFHAVDGAFEEKLPNRFYFGSVVKWLPYANSAINWALYGFLNREYREALNNIFNVLRCRARRRVDSIEVHTIS